MRLNIQCKKNVARCIYAELRLNVNFIDQADGFVACYGIADTSVGLGQVLVSTAKMLEDKGYISKTTRSYASWKIRNETYYGTMQMARTRRLQIPRENTKYVAAYLRYWINIWKPTYSKIAKRPDILGTLYNSGVNARKPNKNPEPTPFGIFVKNNYGYMERLLK